MGETRRRSRKTPGHPKPGTPITARADSASAEYQTLLDLTQSLVATLDPDGRIRDCNGRWEQSIHLPPRDLVGREFADLVLQGDKTACRNAIQRTLAGHPGDEVTLRFSGNGRGPVWLAVSPRLTAARDGLHLVARDVTAEQRCDNATAASLALDELEEGVLVVDAMAESLPVVLANAGFARLSGFTSAEAVGRSLGFLSGPNTDTSALARAIHAARSGERTDLEVCLHRRDGTPLWVRLRLRPVFDATGNIQQIIALHLDITERKLVVDALRSKNQALTEALESLQQTKEAIVQRERMHALGKMASGIVHDFNNLLAPILGFAELLLTIPDLLQDPDKVTMYLTKIRTAANDGAAVVARLREFYRSRSDVEPPANFSIQKAVEETLELTRHRWRNEAQAAGTRISVETNLKRTAPVFGSASEVRQALTNLILNAIDAMPDGGELGLRTYAVGNWVCIQVADTGQGMPEDVRRRCFEPFFTTKGKAGTGLGLAIVFGIVQRHGGRMELASEEGVGTTFTLWLPAAKGDAKTPTAVPDALAADGGRPLRVLLVDDEDLLLEVVSQHLLSMGHSVDCFTEPKAGLESFYRNAHDLVITDRAMPGMTGDQLARLIREFKADTPIVLLTGFGNIIKQNGEQPPNIDVVLSKPLSYQTLREVVARFGGLTGAAPRKPLGESSTAQVKTLAS